MPRPDLFTVFSWNDFERYVLTVFENALRELQKMKSIPKLEILLNLGLWKACVKWHTRRAGHADYFPMVIMLDAANQPQPDDSAFDDRLRKKPDFQCVLHNPLAECAELSQVFYIIECKRLGEPDRADWVFNENYTFHGVVRFRDASHAYAKGFPSAAMIGYVQSMLPTEILNEVNKTSEIERLPALRAPRRWNIGGVTRLPSHNFRRGFLVVEFTLRHLWVDLRRTNRIRNG